MKNKNQLVLYQISGIVVSELIVTLAHFIETHHKDYIKPRVVNIPNLMFDALDCALRNAYQGVNRKKKRTRKLK